MQIHRYKLRPVDDIECNDISTPDTRETAQPGHAGFSVVVNSSLPAGLSLGIRSGEFFQQLPDRPQKFLPLQSKTISYFRSF